MDALLDSANALECHVGDLEISADCAQHLIASLLDGGQAGAEGVFVLDASRARLIRHSVADLHAKTVALVAAFDASTAPAVGGQV